MTQKISHKTFVLTLKKTYPNLYAYMFYDSEDEANYIVRFIKERNIPLSNGKHYVSYQDTWNYIVANEDMHEWWIL